MSCQPIDQAAAKLRRETLLREFCGGVPFVFIFTLAP